jgi:hypothetical protein
VTASALATEQGIAMALRQPATGGRHRKKSNAAAGWTMPREHTTSHAAHRTTPRHRKASPPAASRSTPRHRKNGRGNGQTTHPSFVIGQGNSNPIAPRRAALPGALAVGVLALGGLITAGFSMPMPDANRADSIGPGGTTFGSMPPPPTLTAESTPSSEAGVTLPPMADRGARAPIDASGPAWPISQQALTDDGGGREPTQNATSTRVRDRAPEPGAFAPSVTAEPSGGPGGGGGPAESSMPDEPPAVGGGVLSGLFGPGGPLNGLAGGPGEAADTGDGSAVGGDGSGNRRAEHRDGAQGRNGGAGGVNRGSGISGKKGDAGRPGNRGSDGQTGGGQHRSGGGRH